MRIKHSQSHEVTHQKKKKEKEKKKKKKKLTCCSLRMTASLVFSVASADEVATERDEDCSVGSFFNTTNQCAEAD